VAVTPYSLISGHSPKTSDCIYNRIALPIKRQGELGFIAIVNISDGSKFVLSRSTAMAPLPQEKHQRFSAAAPAAPGLINLTYDLDTTYSEHSDVRCIPFGKHPVDYLVFSSTGRLLAASDSLVCCFTSASLRHPSFFSVTPCVSISFRRELMLRSSMLTQRTH
jgi:hypothetical protein